MHKMLDEIGIVNKHETNVCSPYWHYLPAPLTPTMPHLSFGWTDQLISFSNGSAPREIATLFRYKAAPLVSPTIVPKTSSVSAGGCSTTVENRLVSMRDMLLLLLCVFFLKDEDWGENDEDSCAARARTKAVFLIFILLITTSVCF